MTKTHMPSPFFGRLLHPWADIDRLWGQLMSHAGHGSADSWNPAIDIVESEDAYEVHAELAGVKPADVDVSLNGDVLTIRGKKETEEKKGEGDSWTLRERTWGSFERSFTFPTLIDPESFTALSKDGLLTITVKKAPEAQARQIQIRTVE